MNERRYAMSPTRVVVTGAAGPPVMSMVYARLVAALFSYPGAPPTARILPTSYMTALPFIMSAASARVPALRMEPSPPVVIQFICLLGPAWNTSPFEIPNTQAWLSARKTPWGSFVRMPSTSTLFSRRQDPVVLFGDQTSLCL